MDPVEPWIDGEAVRRMAARLLEKPRAMEIEAEGEAGYGPGFVGFLDRDGADGGAEVASPPVPSGAPPLPEVPKLRPETGDADAGGPPPLRPTAAARAGEEDPLRPLEPEPAAQRERAKPFLPAGPSAERQATVERPAGDLVRGQGRLVERMGKFREWLIEQAEAKGVFILDREGNPVLDDPPFARLHFLARSLAQAYRPAAGKEGNVHVKVGSDAYLVVVPVETAFGWLVMGAVLAEPLDGPSVEAVAQVLREAARPQRG